MKKTILAGLVMALLVGTLSSCFRNSCRETLHSFVVLNIGLMQQKENIEEKNYATLSEFENQVTISKNNPRIKFFRDEAMQVHKKSNELDKYIHNLKIEMVGFTEAVSLDIAKKRVDNPFLIKRKGDYKRPTKFFGTDKPLGNVGKAHDLKEELTKYKTFLMTFVRISHAYKKKVVEDNLKILDLEVQKNGKNEMGSSWEMFYYFHIAQSAALAELTRWQLIVRDAEHEILIYLHDQLYATTFKFDEVLVGIMPKSNIVTSGSLFEAYVFLSAYSPNALPKISYGNTIDTVNFKIDGGEGTLLTPDKFTYGRGRISIPTSGTGERTCEGVYIMTDPLGRESHYIFRTKYKVVAK